MSGSTDHLPGRCIPVPTGAGCIGIGGSGFYGVYSVGENRSAGLFGSPEGTAEKCGTEDWFVQACEKIQYLFPESHSAEYAVSLVRLVWYVLHYPEAASMVLEERTTYRA